MASTRVYRTLADNSQKKGSISIWFKLGPSLATDKVLICSYYDADYHSAIKINTDDCLNVFDWRSGMVSNLTTSRKLRDPSAWYHVVFEWDTTQSTAADRNKLYINGVQETSFSATTNYSADYIPSWNRDYTLSIGARNSDQYWDGNMSHLYFIQGYAYAASTFGSTDATSGIWKIDTSPSVNYTGTGTNSCALKFEDSSNMDLDSGSNANTFTTGGTLTATKDTPSNNFSTFNPLTVDDGGAKTYTTGNTTVTETANSWTSAHSTLMATTGKYYCETKLVSFSGGSASYTGAATAAAIQSRSSLTYPLGTTDGGIGYYSSDGKVQKDNASTTFGDSWGAGDIVGTAIDIDNGFIYFSKNGTWQNSGDPTSGSSGTGGVSLPSGMISGEFIGFSVSPNESVMAVNYGNGYFGTTAITSAGTNASNNGIFEYDVPTGYTALCTKGIDS